MLKLLLLVAIVVVAVLVVRALRHGPRSSDDPAARTAGRAGKLAADTAHISRQGGQGMNQGGSGGGFG